MARRLLIALVVLVFAVAGVVVAAWLTAPAYLVPRLEAVISRATGHKATIRGGIRLAWDGGPAVQARDFALANAAWGSRPDMLVVPRLTATLRLSDLWDGVLRVDTIRLDRPDLLLETNAAGIGNWQSATAVPNPSEGPGSTPAPGARAQLGTVVVGGAHLAYRDGRTGQIYSADVDGTADVAADPVRIAMTLRARTAELHVDGTVSRAAPLSASLALSGRVLVPERVDVAAKLVTGQAGHEVAAEAHGAGVDATLSGVVDPATWRPVGPATLDATMAAASPILGRLGLAALDGPAGLHVLLRQSASTVTLRDLRLTLPVGDLAGELDLTLGKPPSARGSLTSRRIDLARALAWLAAPAPPPAAATVPAPVAGSAGKPPGELVSAALPLQWLDRGNLDLRLAAAEIADGRVTIRDLSGHLVVQDGRLVLDPFGGTGPGGRVELVARADGRAAPPTVAVRLHASALEVQPFVAIAGLPGDVAGTAAVEADLHAAGATRPALLQTLAGPVSLSMGDGDLDLRLFGPLLAAAKLPIEARGRAHLRCLVLRANIAAGVAQVSPLVIDATSLLVEGAGKADLLQRTLDLRLRPLLRTGPGIVVPVRVSGPWSKPKLELDPGDLVGVVAGLAGQSGDACRTAGIVSAMPPPKAKPLKPADLLRSLLR